jgi:SPP1 gp7 family putative phage head morphogenesis protein
MYYVAFSRRANTKQRDMLRKMRGVVRDYKTQIRKAKDLSALMNMEPDQPMIDAFAAAITQIEIAAYVDGRTSGTRKLPKNRRANSRMSFADTPDVDKWLDEHLGFAWDLPGLNAIQSMAQEAADYSQSNISNLLDFIKDDAARALDKGLSFLDWKDQMRLEGYEEANPYHLRTNFDTAANGSYHAGMWHEITQYADIFPYLRYVTVEDDKVREEHQALHGTIAAVEDPFWTIYYPPNGYNCRCSVEQLMQSEAVSDRKFGLEVLSLSLDPRFMKNTGQSNTVFS